MRLQTFPKANVDIYALVLESGGADLAVCISAAGMALADAGIEMEDMVSACSVVSARHHMSYIDKAMLITWGACRGTRQYFCVCKSQHIARSFQS